MRGVFAVDIGTSSLKSGIIELSGTAHSIDRYPVRLDACRADPTVWIDALEGLIARLPDPSAVDGISVSGNGPTIVPVGADGLPSGTANVWLDDREVRIASQPSYFLPKVAWYLHREPSVYDGTRWFVSCPEYIDHYLTGAAVTIVPTEEFSPYYWTEEAVSAYGLDPERLPPAVRPASSIGNGLREELAARWGMKSGIPVFAAGPDFLMSLVGTGTTEPGRTCDRAGTSEGINHCFGSPVKDGRVRTLPHAVAGYYNVAGILSSTGRLFEWLRDITGQTGKPYVAMLEEIRNVPGDSLPAFFPSTHAGARWEFSRGVFVGLGAEHGPAQIGHAVVEAIGYSVREGIDILEEIVGDLGEIRACGGQAKNPVWNQMKADITGKTIVVPEVVDAELLGNAAVAYVGKRRFSTIAEAADSMVRLNRRFHPCASHHRAYEQRYRRYLEAQRRIHDSVGQCVQLLTQ